MPDTELHAENKLVSLKIFGLCAQGVYKSVKKIDLIQCKCKYSLTEVP